MILKYALGHYQVHSHKSHSNLSANQWTFDKKQHVNSIQEIKNQWNQYGMENKGNDAASLSSYLSLLFIMNLPSASRILEVGCGTGKLIPLAIMLKGQATTYLATDLTQNMIQNTKNNLFQNFTKYQSQLNFQDWCQKQNLTFKVANAQSIIEPTLKFDRIICNCVLMITENPHKMLSSLFYQAQKGCLLGISIWGDKQKNPMLKFITQLLKEQSEGQHVRDEFHLYRKVGEMAEKIGWRVVLQWQQNAIVPFLDVKSEDSDFRKTLRFFTNYLPEGKRKEGEKRIREKAIELLAKKEGMNFSTEVYVLQKPF